IGNTPAVFLTQDIPRELKANVLSLGCGDARSILYTAHVAEARNIILFTLILDDNGTRTKDIWDIYYHLVLGPKALALLESQAQKLLAVSDTMESWHASKYGKLLRICDSSSFSEVKKVWGTFLTSALDEAQKSARLDRLRSSLQNAKDLRRHYVGESLVLTGTRSAAPLNLAAFADLVEQHNLFWDTGTTDKSGGNDRNTPNPMFTSQLNDASTLHYGTDPLLGFHLATAYAPLDPNTPPDSHEILQSSANRLVRAARKHFQTWCKSFREHAGMLVLRFFVGEALALCHALQQRKTRNSAGPYRKPGSFQPISLDGQDYQSAPTAPLSFGVIDTSNLADHVGAMNLIIATSPLLDNTLFATLYTESLVRQENNHKALAENFLCGHVLTMSVLLSMFPTEYWTNAVPASTADETLLNTTTRMAGGEDSGCQMYSRLTWKRYIPDSTLGISNRPAVAFEDGALAKILFDVYLNMFQNEDIGRLSSRMGEQSQDMQLASRYHRGSFALLLRFVKNRLPTSNWDKVMDSLFDYIANDGSIPTSNNHIQELFVQLHMLNTYTVQVLQPPPDTNRYTHRPTQLEGWKHLPKVVCLTLKVPRDRLRLLTNLPPQELGTPAVQCTLQSSKTYRGRPFQNIFSTLHLASGTVIISGTAESNSIALEIKEDESCWSGRSPLLVSFFVPTWLLLLDPENAMLAFGIQSTPHHTAALSPILGFDLNVFTTTIGNSDNVFVTKGLPYGANTLPLNTVADTSICHEMSPQGDFRSSVLANLMVESAKIKSFTGHIELLSEKAKSILRNGAEVRTIQESPCSLSILIGKGHKYYVKFPIRVLLRFTKTKIARTSSYIKVIAPIEDPVDSYGDTGLMYPVLSWKPFPVLWNMSRVNLAALPVLDVTQKDRMQWLITHCSLMFSQRENRARESSLASMQDGLMDTRARFKDGLFSIFMHQSGLQGEKAVVFGLNNRSNGGIQVLIFAPILRLDGANRTVSLDAAVIVLTDAITMRMRTFMQPLQSQVCSILVDDEEMQLWKETIPAFVERSRQWSHQPTCEYMREAKIPLSTKNGEKLLCSCGNGKMLDDVIAKFPYLKKVSRFAVRAAISPVFVSPFVEQLYQGRAPPPDQVVQMQKGDQVCWNCGVSKGTGGKELQRCSRCQKARYCSVECQRVDWKAHKASCKA
ncbi:uncharacterized protein K452DRAFT_239420, partial [Aplosporella prunicola CBS 121167]